MPVSGSHGVAGVIGGKLYVLVGIRDIDPECPACSRPVRGFCRYDPSTDRWERMRDCPNNHTKGAAGVTGGKLCVAGGAGPGGDAGGSNSHLDIYDPATNRWTTGAPMPSPGLGLTGAVIGSGLYVLGGEKGEMRFYNSKANRWTMRPSLLTARTFPAMAKVKVNGEARILAVGGHTETGTETEIYTP
jgi:N-acetylneuraminic acid mutarotase